VKPEFIAVEGEQDTDHPWMLRTSKGKFRNYPGGKHHATEANALAAREKEILSATMRHETVNW
jgi:hypothetical protein